MSFVTFKRMKRVAVMYIMYNAQSTCLKHWGLAVKIFPPANQ